jgi:hypothetical protein
MSSDFIQNNIVSNSNVLDQSLNATSIVESDAFVDFAYLSNKCYSQPYRDLKMDNVIELDAYDLSYMDFTSCFYYQSAGNFNINLANRNFHPLLLNNQSYTSTDGKKYNSNLYSLCLKAYATKNQVSENTISPNKKIGLANEVFLCQSLATNTGNQTALSWDICLQTLESTGQIIFTGDSDNEARVSFKLTYVYYSEILNVTISLIYIYKTYIPFYKNVYTNIELNTMLPYSKYEDKSIEEIKKELKKTINTDHTFLINPTKFANVIKNQEDNIDVYIDDASISCESTIKTTALLKEISSGLWSSSDNYDNCDNVKYSNEIEYEDDEYDEESSNKGNW